MDLEIFVWAIFGGLFLALIGGGALYYNNKDISTKQLSRDFILGAIATAMLYPILPESLDMKTLGVALPTETLTAEKLVSFSGPDPGVQVGPANF